jgi:7-cyano-7-deazaguanine synthase
MKGLIVLSGGMDSATAIPEARANGIQIDHAVHFQYGSKHNEREISVAWALSSFYRINLDVIPLPFIGQLFKSDLLKSGGEIPEGHYEDESMKRTVVPFRNGIMLSIAAGLAESYGLDAVILGNHKGDHAIYPDCREEFTIPMADAIRKGTYAGIQLVTPFRLDTKKDIVQRGMVLGVPYEMTWSCYKGGGLHCGKCGTCVERKEAFEGLVDPTIYEKSDQPDLPLGGMG